MTLDFFHIKDLYQHVINVLSLEAATRDSTTRSITAMSTVATYRDFKLVKGQLQVTAKEWVKTAKKNK